MKRALTAQILLLAAALLPACSALTEKSPPKTEREMEAEARRTHTVPDNVRDPRPEMPPMGPLAMPMR
jgi:outer membrane biogenesis lipoprotein LolB